MSDKGNDNDKVKVSELLESEDVLPILYYRKEIMTAIKSNQIVIIVGETGSGKTTQLPQFIVDDKEFDNFKAIAVTQPRRVAATAMAIRVSDERNCKVGAEVGYTIRFEDNTSRSTKIKYMTDGILVKECLKDPNLSNYSVVMLDEAHERSLNTDVLFGLIKSVCLIRSDIKVLVTSATLNEDKFSKYFNNAPIIHIPGRIFPVDIFHSKIRQVMTTSGPASLSYVNDAVELVLQIHETENEDGHILVFLTGQDEIDRACSMINNSQCDGLVVLPLYSTLSNASQLDIFKKISYPNNPNKFVRKCIVATNIAETSITVPNIRFVIDCGYVKQKAYDPTRHMESLIVVPISQVSSQQRAGRAGRTGPGKCYRLYSSDCYQNMMIETIPEILRTNLTNTVLYLKVIGIQDVLAFDFLDAPSENLILEGLLLLHMLGAIDDVGNCTDIGRKMSKLPLEPKLSKSVIRSIEFNCLSELINISSLLSVESVWYEPSRHVKKSNSNDEKYQKYLEVIENQHSILRHPSGDHLTYLNIMNNWENIGRCSKSWCEENFINFRAMSTAKKIRDQLLRDVTSDSLLTANNKRVPQRADIITKDLEDRVTSSLLSGFYMNAVRCCSTTTFRSLNTKGGRETFMYRTLPLEAKEKDNIMMLYLHPSSVLSSFTSPHQFLMYQDLVMVSGKTYIRQLTSVNPIELNRYTSAWKEPSDLLMLTGRKSQVIEVIAEDVLPICKKESVIDGTVHGRSDISISTQKKSSVDDAKERYLSRKKFKK